MPTNPRRSILGCCARAASGHEAAAPPSAASNSRRPMVTVIRPSRARCVKATIPRHRRAVFTFGRAGTPLLSASDLLTAEVLADDRLCGHRFQAQTFRGECRKPLAMPLHGQVVDGDVLPVRIAKIARPPSRAEFIQTRRLEMANSIEAEVARRAAQVVAYPPEISFPV